MRIRTRIMAGYLLVALAGFGATWRWVEDDVIPHYSQSIEESLVDVSRLLAGWLESGCGAEGIETGALAAAFETARLREFEARLYEETKRDVSLRVYVAGLDGRVLFDSNNGEWTGRDFSQWRDVYLTLRGQYGARATRAVRNDPLTTTLFVAAPVYCHGRLAGVVTAAKPVAALAGFIRKSQEEIAAAALAVSALTACAGLVVAAWLARPIDRLTRYVRAVKEGRRVPPPEPGNSELGELAAALEEMRDALEGRQYAENYVQSLAHGLKSPLAGIRAAAELLDEDMEPAQRAKFLGDIQVEVRRLDRIVDRLLLLAAVEQRKGLPDAREFDFAATVRQLGETFAASAVKTGTRLEVRAPGPLPVHGDEFLCEQAAANLIQNALDFTPAGGRVELRAGPAVNGASLEVLDTGPGIPEYARGRLFERFFSLPRPATGKKSSGLGLSFVKEVCQLHGGGIAVENRPEGGARAVMTLAARPPQ